MISARRAREADLDKGDLLFSGAGAIYSRTGAHSRADVGPSTACRGAVRANGGCKASGFRATEWQNLTRGNDQKMTIELYAWNTPNGRKISVALEEMGLPYNVHPVNISKNEQFAADFLKHGHYAACSSSLNDSFAKLSAPDLRSVALCSYYIGRDDIVMNATAKILKDAPADAEALYWRIQSAERLGLAALAEATNINPNSASLHALTGDMLREKGDLAEAADEYRKAIAVKPEFLSAHLGLARVLNSDHKSDDAEHELQYVLTANPDDPEANYLMGEILVNRSNLADALSFLLKALQVTPEELPYVHADLSQVYEDRGDLPQAIAELKQALSIDVDGSFYFRLGRLYARTGDRSAAAQALDQSAKLRRQADAAAQFVK